MGQSEPSASTPLPWGRILVAIAIAAAAYWNYSGHFWSPHAEDQFFDQCFSTGIPGGTCGCMVNWFEANGYTPNDLEGEGYPPEALQAALDCPRTDF
ncbi:MAG: hypothetical protein ACLGIB_12490 [Actinomycetota bacterium]